MSDAAMTQCQGSMFSACLVDRRKRVAGERFKRGLWLRLAAGSVVAPPLIAASWSWSRASALLAEKPIRSRFARSLIIRPFDGG